MLNFKRSIYASLLCISYLSLSSKSFMVSIYSHLSLYQLMLERKNSFVSDKSEDFQHNLAFQKFK